MERFETEIYLRYKQIIESQSACAFLNTFVIPGGNRQIPRRKAEDGAP